MSLLTTQDPEAIERRERFCWVEAGVWTDRMLAALGNGVKGGKWTSTVAEFLLRRAWPVHLYAGVHYSEPIPMWKHLTGEPYAAEPHVRFGGRGGLSPSRPLSGANRKTVGATLVANITLFVAQRPAQDFANIGLRQVFPELDLLWHFVSGQVVTAKIQYVVFGHSGIASNNK